MTRFYTTTLLAWILAAFGSAHITHDNIVPEPRYVLLSEIQRFEPQTSGKSGAETCPRVKFSEEPSWATNAEWSAEDGELLITDIRSGHVLAFKKDGRRVSSKLAAQVEYHKAFSRDPIAVKRQGRGHILQLTGERFVRLGVTPGPSDLLDLTYTKVQAGPTDAILVRIWDWVPAGRDLVLLGDLYLLDASLEEPERKISGVVRLKVSDDFKAVEANLLGDHWLFESPTWRRHRVILNLLTASESGQIYFMRLDDAPRIYTNTAGSTHLEPLGSLTARELGASLPPEIPDVSLQQITLIMAEVESSTLISGIYWWNGYLYALHREPSGNDLTRWSLIKINPENGEELATRRLPTLANHLLVAPGETWALIEKGRYWDYGDQDIPSVYLMDGQAVSAFRMSLCDIEERSIAAN